MRRASKASRQREHKSRYVFVRFQQAAAAMALAEHRADIARAALLLLVADDFADPSIAASHLEALRAGAPDGSSPAAMRALSRLTPRRSPA